MSQPQLIQRIAYRKIYIAIVGFFVINANVWAKDELVVNTVVVSGSRTNQIGIAQSANVGSGFHSNDARGTTITIDPKSGEKLDKVTPLVNSTGMELGVCTSLIVGLQNSFSLYRLDFDSELVFVGDAGTTEAGRPSRRTEFELSNYYKLNDWLTVDADLAFARARFRDDDPAGQRISGAVDGVASLAFTVDNVGAYLSQVHLE